MANPYYKKDYAGGKFDPYIKTGHKPLPMKRLPFTQTVETRLATDPEFGGKGTGVTPERVTAADKEFPAKDWTPTYQTPGGDTDLKPPKTGKGKA